MLRNLTEEDLPNLFKQQLDPAGKIMAGFTNQNPNDESAFESHWRKNLVDPTIIAKVVLHENKVAGYIAKFERFGLPEMTYWLGAEYRGKGLGTNALKAFLKHIEIRPIHARTAYDNTASIQVLRKCGFIKTGKEIDEFVWKLDS